MRRRRSGSFANADAKTGEQQLGKGHRGAAECGHAAPYREPDSDHILSRGAIGKARKRKSGERIKKNKGGAQQPPELGIGQAHIGLDVLGDQRQNLPVDKIQDVGEQ